MGRVVGPEGYWRAELVVGASLNEWPLFDSYSTGRNGGEACNVILQAYNNNNNHTKARISEHCPSVNYRT